MMIKKYKEMTKREKEQMARRVVITVGSMTVGVIIGMSFKQKRYAKEIEFLQGNLECLESDVFELDTVIDRQTLRMSELIKENEEQCETVDELLGDVVMRDLSIMEHFDGDSMKYRGLRSNIFEQDELILRANKLDEETGEAEFNYRAFKSINKK